MKILRMVFVVVGAILGAVTGFLYVQEAKDSWFVGAGAICGAVVGEMFYKWLTVRDS